MHCAGGGISPPCKGGIADEDQFLAVRRSSTFRYSRTWNNPYFNHDVDSLYIFSKHFSPTAGGILEVLKISSTGPTRQ